MNKKEFKKAREKLKMTQDQMGEALGDGTSRYSVRAVASWESGERKVPPAVGNLVNLMLTVADNDNK